MGNFSIRENGNVIVSPSMTFLPHDNAIINKLRSSKNLAALCATAVRTYFSDRKFEVDDPEKRFLVLKTTGEREITVTLKLNPLHDAHIIKRIQESDASEVEVVIVDMLRNGSRAHSVAEEEEDDLDLGGLGGIKV